MKLITQTLFVMFTLGLSQAFGVTVSKPSQYSSNKEYHRAQPGQRIFIDSANQDFISVFYLTQSQNRNAMPEVKLLKQWSGFECQHLQTFARTSGFDPATGKYIRDWEIQIDYSPGADLSGCIYLIRFPDAQDATVEIFMNY